MAGETRTGGVTPFDNVVDYSGVAALNPITDLANTSNPNLAGYNATINIAAEDFFGITSNAANLNALRIVVSVGNNVNGDRVVLESYRTRYAPNFVP